MKNSYLRIPVIRFKQNGQVLYIGVMNSSDVNKVADVDVRDEQNNPNGYQRYREESRCRKIAEFINCPTSYLPGSILVNLSDVDGLDPSGPKGNLLPCSD